jgi:riboflavin biosynthesis pyrimidine reductase
MSEYQYRTTVMREPRERKVVATARSSIWKGFLLTSCITLLLSPSFAFAWNCGSGQILSWRKISSPHILLAASPRSYADADSSSSKSRSDDSSAVKGVTLKIALDANGGAADLGDIKLGRFTSPESLDMVHRLRCVSDAVLVGRGTVQEDDCTLTVRRVPLGDRPQPIRVVLDPRLFLLLDAGDVEVAKAKSYKMFEDGLPTVVYHSVRDVDYNSLNLKESVTCVYLPSSAPSDTTTANTITSEDSLRQGGHMSAKEIVQDLAERFNVHHLMVEGGPATAKLFLQEHVVDRVILVRAPLCFHQPLDAGITSTVLKTAGLQLLGLVTSENVDQIECWSRPGNPWPAEELDDWP